MIILILFFKFSISEYSSDHALSISFTAPWSPVSLADQMFSYFLQYSNEAARRFLFDITSNKGEKIDDDEYLWSKAKEILPSSYLSIMKANIDFGATIPSSIFNGFDSNPNIKDINITDTQKFQTDFIFHGNNNLSNPYNNIIYTDIQKGSETIHDLLSKETPFVLRSTPKSTEKSKSKVRGYGIEIRPFKYSMEYNVKNLEEKKDTAQETIKITDKTTQNIPTKLEENLTSLSFENFEFKFSNYLKENTNKENYTKLLRDITNNWPLYLKDIDDSEPDVQTMRMLRSSIDYHYGSSNLNGRFFKINDIDSFTFLQMINEEKDLNDILHSKFNFSENQIEWFTTTNLYNQNVHFFDFRSDLINYYNDIEKDDKYKNWPRDIRILNNYKRAIPRIQKNVINSVLYFDPLSIDGMSEFFSLIFLAMNMYPITVGVIPIFRMDDPVSRKVAFAYHHLNLHNRKEGLNFLLRAFNYIEKSDETGKLIRIDEEAFAKSFDEIKSTKKNKKKWSHINELFNPNTDEYKAIQEVVKYYKSKNLKIDTVSVNGIIFPAPSASAGYMDIFFKSFSYIVPILQNLKNDEKAMSNHIIDSIIEEGSFPVIDKIDNQIFTDEIESIDLHTLNRKDQIRFINDLEKIEWYNDINQESIDTYAFILSGSNLNKSISFDEKGFTVIDEFIQKQNKKETKSQILFAVDPSFDSNLLSYIPIENYPLLIINGRIIKNFNYTNINEYYKADTWNYDYVTTNYQNLLKNNHNKLLKFYIYSISNSWRSNSIQRGRINAYMPDYENPLRYRKIVNDALELSLIINPFKRAFQRFIDMIEYVDSHDVLSITMVLNPHFNKEDDMQTLSSFYRSSTTNDDVVFTYLNDRITYSSMIDVPNSWQAESLYSLFDLDNILLSELNPNVHKAEYILTNIIVEGSCVTKDSFPAAGSRLSIYPPNSILSQDKKKNDYYNENYACKSETIVMEPQNGYFQLMGTIGPNIISYETNQILVEVNSFSLKKAKMILSDVTKNTIKNKRNNIESHSYKNSSRIDVFGVASGHLYERLIKIMMLSVKRHTEPKTTVTFWLLNNFLSPQFKAVLPQMALKYEFKYKLVKYKWPNWIHPQFEKQRIIWGNKILFLDVLFPPDLDRIIYVDSDQIVRTDLNELMKMDFGDAPYAFTPFCDSRIETEPYRFWKRGSWKIQLQDMAYLRNKNKSIKVPKPLKYHISALFAIDLPTFRKLNGGDVLRMFYNSLAIDKNSLANLDQDLPNFAQSYLPIFSLPQEWLWCETWCSDETMDKAKTIDLCNNPLHKRPKLEIAQTRVNEWPGLDREVAGIEAPNNQYDKMLFN